MSVKVCSLNEVFQLVSHSFVFEYRTRNCYDSGLSFEDFWFSSIEGEDVTCPLTEEEKKGVKSLIKDFISENRVEEAEMVFDVNEKTVTMECWRRVRVHEKVSF